MISIEIKDHCGRTKVEVGKDFIPEAVIAIHAVIGAVSEALDMTAEDAMRLMLVSVMASAEKFKEAKQTTVKIDLSQAKED